MPSGVFSSMTRSMSNVAFRLCLSAATLALVLIDPAHVLSAQNGSAIAQASDRAEKEAFNAAKELGTVEAWDAFLSNYPTGFRADLARAYLKKLANDPAAMAPPPAAPASDAYPMPAGSWGGVVRDGPGQNSRKVGSLQEGDPVTLIGPAGVVENGYPWFQITYPGGGGGFQWGGILCSTGAERPDLFKTCSTAAQREEQRASLPRKCRENGGEWGEDQCWPKGHFDRQARQKQRGCPSGTFFDKANGRCMSFESQEDGPGELNEPPPKVNKTGTSCKELKAQCSKTDSNADCDRYLSSCSGHGDN